MPKLYDVYAGSDHDQRDLNYAILIISDCPAGYYGPHCNEVCECENGSPCDPGNGQCACRIGFYGEKCQLPCPPGEQQSQ